MVNSKIFIVADKVIYTTFKIFNCILSIEIIFYILIMIPEQKKQYFLSAMLVVREKMKLMVMMTMMMMMDSLFLMATYQMTRE